MLSDQHTTMLTKESGISEHVIAARQYRTVTTKVELKGLGFSDSQVHVPALLIPVWNVHGDTVLYQARPDSPRIKNGKAIKYETLFGSTMAVDVNPLVKQRLGDPHYPLLVTEGSKKADAAVSHELCCVALLGVWNWRGTNRQGGGRLPSLIGRPSPLMTAKFTSCLIRTS